ncbi:SGNH/GDSL hydrolase family protein [Streptomyces sp. NPDC091377]|uniref:SGNH/GDSL hydrolase family protein n=1 Tax=Streptomyces sp. NPDC091377 TaxID=3365995 RepID=UPI00381DEAFC
MLAPQLAHYQTFAMRGVHWLPYVMYFNQPNYRSPVINTDSQGFRFSHGEKGRYALGDECPEGPVSLLMGGSSAFGFGAGSDRTTLSSLLGQESGGTWLNLAAPAFNSTQEVLLFLLHRHQLSGVRDVVIFSGLNNLVVAGLPGADQGYGQFFFSGDFYGELRGVEARRTPISHTAGPATGLRRLLPPALSRLLSRPARGDAAPPGPPLARRIEIAADAIRHDLDRLIDLLAPTGARVSFALQPAPHWCGKKLSAEETVLLGDNGSLWSKVWAGFRPALVEEAHAGYAEAIGRACKERGITFVDVNTSLPLVAEKGEWLFVDPVHLNDRGNALVAEVLCRELNLGETWKGKP